MLCLFKSFYYLKFCTIKWLFIWEECVRVLSVRMKISSVKSKKKINLMKWKCFVYSFDALDFIVAHLRIFFWEGYAFRHLFKLTYLEDTYTECLILTYTECSWCKGGRIAVPNKSMLYRDNHGNSRNHMEPCFARVLSLGYSDLTYLFF